MSCSVGVAACDEDEPCMRYAHILLIQTLGKRIHISACTYVHTHLEVLKYDR